MFAKALIRILALASMLALPLGAYAQANVQPQNRNLDTGTLQTLSGQAAGTVNSSDVNNYNVRNVICTWTASTPITGSPLVALSIQNKSQSGATYYNVITSAANASTSTFAVAAGEGIATTSNVSAGIPISPTWRTSVAVTGTTSTTGLVRCMVN